jgi:hypothetical protein
MANLTFEDVFISYGIHPKFWAGMQACVMADAKPEAELQVRLNCVENFRKCLLDLKSAGTRRHPELTPAVVPFESIEVPDE